MNWTKEKKSNLVALIKGYREIKGLSQAQMAGELGISERTYWRWEKNKSYPNPMACTVISQWLVEEAKVCTWSMIRGEDERN